MSKLLLFQAITNPCESSDKLSLTHPVMQFYVMHGISLEPVSTHLCGYCVCQTQPQTHRLFFNGQQKFVYRIGNENQNFTQ